MNLELIRAIQRMANPLLDILFQCVTMLGEQYLLAALFCTIYWCVDKRLGRYLVLALCASVCLNGIVKDFVKAPRPIGQDGIFSLRTKTATGYSFPSGHSQSAAAFWWGIALWIKRGWAYPLLGAVVLAVGFSRLYLGVHYPIDVVAGIALGVLSAFAFDRLVNKKRLVFSAVAVVLLLGLLAIVAGESSDTIRGGAMAMGLSAGFLLENRVDFQPARDRAANALRLALGMAVIGAVYLVPGLFMPHTLLLKSLQIAFIAFWGLGGYPWLFTRLGL